jgi:AraC-like DNA-binding protein
MLGSAVADHPQARDCRDTADPQSTMSTSRNDIGVRQRESATDQLFSCAHEDIARLSEILHSQRCTTVMRGVDGVVIPLNAAASAIDDGRSDANAAGVDPPSNAFRLRDVPALCAPIYDAEGRLLTSLEVIQGDRDRSVSSEKLLRALIECAARAITERWFRLIHRRLWIVAAARRDAPGTSIVLAADRDQRLLGADRKARELLQSRGRRFEKHLGLSEFFQSSPALFRRRSYRDVAVTLRGSSDGDPWIALITPPDIGAIETCQDAHAVLHARPRLSSLAHLWAVSSKGREQRGLSHGALRRVEEYIDAHLGSALDVNELAAIVRMSPSHFTRSFQKSVGLTPHRYVIQHRVMRARELLASTELPLTEIALTVGFSDQSHFCRRFHELVGVPPGAFRGHNGSLRQ